MTDLSPLARAAVLIAQARALRKRCVKCDRIIRKPVLVDAEPERCARCGDS